MEARIGSVHRRNLKGRSRGPANPYTTISDHERFKKAFGTDEK